VSKACRHESEYLFFRSTTLHDSTSIAKILIPHLIKRLTDDHNRSAEHVRHLTVGNFVDEGLFYFELTPCLDKILTSTKNLQSLTWTGSRSIHPATLDLFHKLHPSTRLHLQLRPRTLTPLIPALLSSAQVHSLEITLYHSIEGETHHNEVDFIKKHIINSNLRVLHLDSERVPRSHIPRFRAWESVSQAPLNFAFQPEDRFPPLEELRFTSGNYAFSEEHCNMWAQAMDWTALRTLHLGPNSPRYLFVGLTDRAVNLESLSLAISSRRSSKWSLGRLDTGLPLLVAFMASIKALRELNFAALEVSDFTATLQGMLDVVGHSLRTLVVKCEYQPLKPDAFVEFLRCAPNLEYLKAKLRSGVVEGQWVGLERKRTAEEKWEDALQDLHMVVERDHPTHRMRQLGP
jgi:hypothetical protein